MDESNCIENLSRVYLKFAIKEVGPEEIVTNRRILVKIGHDLNEIKRSRVCPHTHVLSGSVAEGFIKSVSNRNTMLVYESITVVIENRTDSSHSSNGTVFTMETDQTRQGFCLLRLLTRSDLTENGLFRTLVAYQNEIYLSSALWNNVFTEHLPSPRGDGKMNDLHDAEMDIFHCLKSTQWPTSALPCIQRLVDRGWPSNNVLSNIVRTGCHLVPMGDGSSDKQQLEWRISFSEAETALVCEMNHCQFLCFGFLKIFLQRVINTREEIGGLLCSYIMKTTILWEIIYNRGRWAKQDFLKLFWNCFRRLMSWIRNGYCPDFFIPENNLFFGKIYGRTQRVLLQQLIPLYNEGYRCLPVCNCVGCMSVLLQPNTCSLHTIDIDFSKVTVDLMVIKDEVDTLLSIDDISILFKQITLLEQIQRQNVSYNTSLIAGYFLHLQTQYFLFCSALQIFGNSYSSHNKDNYKSVCKFGKALKRNRFDLLTHDILSAMLFYKLGMHRHALRIALDMRQRIQRTYLMYYWTLDLEAYRAAGGEINPVDIMMRRHFLKTLSLHESMCLPELLLEHQSLEDSIEYHPVVLVYFLLFLCYHRLSMHNGADSVLTDLVTLVNNDYRYHIPDKLRGISLEILGICQEMGGYTDEARASYNQVLQEPQCRKFREVTRYRLQNLN